MELADAGSVPVIVGLDSVGSDQTALTHRAAAVNAYAAGAQGIMYHRYYPPPRRYPYSNDDYSRLRYLAYPDIMAHKDKTFYVGPGTDRRNGISFGLQEQLPQELSVGERGRDVTIDILEDIAIKAQDGELWRCELRIMLEEMLHHDEVKVFWNEQEVPEENIRKAERVFQMRETSRARGY